MAIPSPLINSQSIESRTQALEHIRTAPAEQALLVDFDETLFLRNSTQEYLSCATPQAPVAFMLMALNVIKPWQWLAKDDRSHLLRDWYRVVLVTIMMPWTLLIWQRRAKYLAETFVNPAIRDAIQANPQANVTVASNGFSFIIAPLLRHMALPQAKLLACRFWRGGRDRQRGKLSLVTAAIGPERIDRSLLLTDSEEDAPLLNRVANPHLVVWPDAQCVSILDNAYLPLFYMQRVKKKGTDNFVKKTAMNEFLPLVLTLSWLSPHPLLHSIGLALLFFSFWCIYEVGYMENDLVAEHHEDNPTLSANYQKYKGKINYSEPWLWATLSAIPALFLWEAIEQSALNGALSLGSLSFSSLVVPTTINLLIWLGTLVLLRLTYWVYNYIDEQTRVWLYPVLQIFKYASFLLLTASNSIVALYFSAQVIARWIPYLIYRNGNLNKFPQFPIQGARLAVFLFLLLPLCLTEGIAPFVTLQAACILLILMYRAKSECLHMIRNAKPLSLNFLSLATTFKFLVKGVFRNPFYVRTPRKMEMHHVQISSETMPEEKVHLPR